MTAHWRGRPLSRVGHGPTAPSFRTTPGSFPGEMLFHNLFHFREPTVSINALYLIIQEYCDQCIFLFTSVVCEQMLLLSFFMLHVKIPVNKAVSQHISSNCCTRADYGSSMTVSIGRESEIRLSQIHSYSTLTNFQWWEYIEIYRSVQSISCIIVVTEVPVKNKSF